MDEQEKDFEELMGDDGDDGELAVLTSGMRSLAYSGGGGAAAEPDDEPDADESIDDTTVVAYSSKITLGLKQFTDLGIKASGDKTVGADINQLHKDTLALLKANELEMQEQLVFTIVMNEADKYYKANYEKVKTASVQLSNLNKHIEKLYHFAVFDENELKELGTKINAHLNEVLIHEPAIVETNYFIQNMKRHDVAFLENMQEYVNTSKKVKELSIQIMKDQIKMAFWSVVQQKEKGERDAKKKARAPVLPEKAAKKKTAPHSSVD